MPCNFHLRDLAEAVKEGVREAGGTPMEFNSIAISDGITMGTEGMKTSLVSREVIADSIELTVRGLPVRRRRGDVRLRQDDPRRGDGAGPPERALGDALRRVDRSGALAREGRDDPGRLRGDRRPRGGQHVRRGAAGARGLREPGRRSLRRPVHREHDGVRVRGDGHLADGLRDGAGDERRQGGGRARGGQAGGQGPQRRPAVPSKIITAESIENAIALRVRLRRLDQRRPPPARGRARGRDRHGHRRLRADLASDTAPGRT